MNAQEIIATDCLHIEFNNLSTALNFLDNCISPSKWKVMLGDNGKFWVLANRHALVLEKAGYEYAN